MINSMETWCCCCRWPRRVTMGWWAALDRRRWPGGTTPFRYKKLNKKFRFQPRQDLFRLCLGLFLETNKNSGRFGSKQPEIFWKDLNILSVCFSRSSVCFGSIETPKLSVFWHRSETAETNVLFRIVPKPSFGSSFGCFESKLVSVPVFSVVSNRN